MKKIIKEWKRWLLETKPTEKFMAQPEREPRGPYDRRMPDYFRGDHRNTFKEALKQYVTDGSIIKLSKFFSHLKKYPKQRMEIASDLIAIHQIYKTRKHELYISDNLSSGFMFNDQPYIKSKNPEKKIEPIVKMMGDMKIVKDYFINSKANKRYTISTDKENEVLGYYISQNLAAVMAEPPPPLEPSSPPSRFSRQLGVDADMLDRMNKAAWLKNKRRG